MTTNTFEYLQYHFNDIERIIGYRFGDRKLLIQAFTSKSYGAENPNFVDNDVLEFYGDAELYKFMSDWLFDSFTVYPDGKRSNQLSSEKTVGQLSEIRKNYINKKALARCLRLKHLDQFVLLGKSDLNNNASESDSILEDVFEAIIGAVKADSEKLKNSYSLYTGNTDSKESIKKVCKNLYELFGYGTDWIQEIYDFCDFYGFNPEFTRYGFDGNYTCRLVIQAIRLYVDGQGKSFEIAKMEACKNAMNLCKKYDMLQDIGQPDFDRAVSQLNTLFQKEYITKPDYQFKNTTDSSGFQIWRCECFIKSCEDKPNYMQRGIGEESSKNEAKKAAALDMLKFIFE